MSPEGLAVAALCLGAVLGLLAGWGVWAPEPTRSAPPLADPPPPEPPARPRPPPPPGLDFAARGFRASYAEPCLELGREITAAALLDFGVAIGPAIARAERGRSSRLGQSLALDLVQMAWIEGVRDMAHAVRASSPLPSPVTDRLLDVAHRRAFDPDRPPT